MIKKVPYQVLSSKSVYKNPWINVREDQVIHPNGKNGIFGVIEVKSGVNILAIDDDNNAYLVKTYQYGIEKDSLEVVSGGIEENETPIEAAKRELKEETGLEAETWVDLGVTNNLTTIVNSTQYMFLATNIKQGKSNLDETEFLDVIKVNFDELVNMVLESKVFDSTSCVLILKAAMKR